MISSAAQSREPDLALGYLEEMMAAFLQPNIMTYTNIIHAFSKASKHREAIEWLNIMADAQHSPNVLSYTCAIEACLRTNAWDEVLGLLQRMQLKGVRADSVLVGKLKRLMGSEALHHLTLSSSRRSPSWRYLRDQQERSLKNSSRGQAYNQALNGLEELLFQRPALSDLIQATSALEEEGMCFSDLFQRFFGSGRCLVEGLIVGNLDWADAIQLLNATLGPWRDVWHQEAVLEPCDRLCNVPSPVEMLLPRSRLGRDLLTIVQLDGKNSEDRNSCSVESLCNIATSTPENEALAALLMQIWKSMFYNELRTRQQLGYVVSSFMRTRVTHISLIFLVQTERAPEVALKSIDRFLDHACHHILSVLTEREFHEHCESLALQLEEPPQNIWEALSQDWLFIQERSFAFRSRKQQVTLLRSCTLQRLRDFVKNEAKQSNRTTVITKQADRLGG
eukprot:g21114.t1